MPKPQLIPEESLLERDLIETFLAGHKQWRPDLSYPESHSDMQACVRALLIMYEVKRRPLPGTLHIPCPDCQGLGKFVLDKHNTNTCDRCHGRGKINYTGLDHEK